MQNKTVNLPKEEQPQERLMNNGVAYLSNQELLSVMLGNNTDDSPAKAVLEAFEGISLLNEATIEELTAIQGIASKKGALLLAAIELGKRVNQYKPNDNYIIRSPEDGADYLMEEMRTLKQEHLVALYLDTKNRIIHKETIFIGSLNASVVHPREIYKVAIKRSAASIIICHNHPSQSEIESQADIDVSKRVKETGNIIGIELLDSLIIGGRKFTSLKEKGYL